MSDRFASDYRDDEPVIGGTYAPPAPPPPPGPQYIGGGPGIGFAPPPDHDEEPYADEAYEEDEYYEDDEDEEYGYYDDDYDGAAPARQPMFYVFIALAALVGGIVVFLLFSLVHNGKDDNNGGSSAATKFAVSIDSPPKDKRIEIGKPEDVIVQASATEPIVRFELFVGDTLTDSVQVTDTPPDNKYRSVLHLTLNSKGNYSIFVRVTAQSGATKDSSKTSVIAIEPVGERPQTIKGKVVADTTMRAGPGDQYPEAGTLKGGQEVTILGKSKALDWLLIDSAQGGRWAKRTAIDPLDSLDLVPIRDVTPTPAPTVAPTNTSIPSPSPSASVSPSPNPNAPDFVPTSAVLIDGGTKLRVTIQNVSNTAYNGPLVVGVGGDVPGSEVAIDAKLNANGGSATVDFDLSPAIKDPGKKAVVTVDPKNSVKEQREDNNSATFVLLPPEEAPDIQVASVSVGTTIDVTLKNVGGALQSTNVTVKVSLGGDSTSKSVSLALAPNQTSAVINATRPGGTGEATIEVIIGGQTVATAKVTIV